MFAEDIGLLPRNYFTSLLYDGAKRKDVERRLHELFTQMNTRDLPAPRVVPYFNGGLFTDVMTLPLGDAQIMALTKAAEANWTFVDPHIFGSVFQGIMDDAERHASGAHYTAHDDIMRVVGPTIIEPWRKRIAAATSLKELTALRKELFAFRVLDSACGSGNFLYVAFRELYRLDTELLSRMREWASTAGKVHPEVLAKGGTFDGWESIWWQHWRPRRDFFRQKDAQAALDAAVADAYGMPPDQDPTEFLLELNHLVAEDEQQGRKLRGPGLPDHVDPKAPHWLSTDCIEPPKVES